MSHNTESYYVHYNTVSLRRSECETTELLTRLAGILKLLKPGNDMHPHAQLHRILRHLPNFAVRPVDLSLVGSLHDKFLGLGSRYFFGFLTAVSSLEIRHVQTSVHSDVPLALWTPLVESAPEAPRLIHVPPTAVVFHLVGRSLQFLLAHSASDLRLVAHANQRVRRRHDAPRTRVQHVYESHTFATRSRFSHHFKPRPVVFLERLEAALLE